MKKILKFTFFLIFLLTIINCSKTKKDIYLALEKFDNSLDSLILEKTYNKPNILIFQADTLHGNPRRIDEICYQIIGNDSIKTNANCHIYKFENNELVMNSSETSGGQKFVQKYIYFDEKINNKRINEFRNKKSDTIYFGYVKKYNKEGKLIKSVKSTPWRNVQKNGITNLNENRLLEIYRHNNDNTRTTWRKEYFNKKYNIDSLLNTKITEFTSQKSSSWANDKVNYSYKKDKFGNWIIKRRRFRENPEVYYRKYYY